MIEKVNEEITRIVLDKPDGLPPLASEPTNVYLLHGDAPALVDAGHPSQYDTLCRALREIDIEVSDLERIIYTSWSVEVLGAAANLPNVDHFVFSPDMVQPSNFEAHLATRRAEFHALAERVVAENKAYDENDLDEVDAFLSAYYPPMPSNLRFIPIRSGQVVAAGAFRFEVMATPGPDPGHIALYDAQKRTLFGGSFSASGLPERIDEVQAYLISLERLQKLDVDTLLPRCGKPARKRGDWTLRRALRFLNNFMNSAPAAMHNAPTVIEFIERDLGHHIDDLAELILQLERYKPPMDELVRARMIDADGEGLARRYGVDVEDDRARLRPDN